MSESIFIKISAGRGSASNRAIHLYMALETFPSRSKGGRLEMEVLSERTSVPSQRRQSRSHQYSSAIANLRTKDVETGRTQ